MHACTINAWISSQKIKQALFSSDGTDEVQQLKLYQILLKIATLNTQRSYCVNVRELTYQL